MIFSNDAPLTPVLCQLLPRLLADHAYGLCDLARDCAEQLHEPLAEIMTPLGEALCELAACGQVSYDRQANLVKLA